MVTAYALAFGSLLLVGGRLGDMYSRKWVLITGLIGFAVASAIGGAAVSFVMLVSARALQGAFGAILAPSALGTLVSTFRDPLERGRAFAVFGSVAVGGGAVGLILGGVLTQYLSWRYTLFVNLIFAAIAVAGALAYIRSSRPASPPRMDWPGAVLACAGLFLIVFGFSHAETAGWTATLTLGSLILGAVLLTAFVVAERRSSHPLLPLRVVLDRTRGGSYVAVGIHRNCALRDLPVPHLLHAAGQGIQPADHRAAVPAAGRRDPGCLHLVQRRAPAQGRAPLPGNHQGMLLG